MNNVKLILKIVLSIIYLVSIVFGFPNRFNLSLQIPNLLRVALYTISVFSFIGIVFLNSDRVYEIFSVN